MPTLSVPLHVFVSYSRSDAPLVGRIQSYLAEQGIPTWLDHKELLRALNWEGSIRQALEHAYAVVLVATPSSANSSFVQTELA